MSEFQITIDSELPPVTIDSTEVGNIMYHTAAAMQTTAESLLAAIVAASAAFDSDFESNDRRALVSELDHLASAAADLRTAALQSKRLASKADLAQLGELFTVPALLRTLGEGVSINDLMGAIRKHRDFAFGAVFTREDFPGGVIPEGFDGKYISDTLVERGGLYIAEEA